MRARAIARAADTPAESVVRQGIPRVDRRAADLPAVACGRPTPVGVLTTRSTSPALDPVDDVRGALADLVQRAATGTPMRAIASAVPRGGDDPEAEVVQRSAAIGERAGLVGVGDRDEDGALARQRHAGGRLRLGERGREVAGDAHHLAGRAHLGPEQRVGAVEAVERQHRLLDRDVVAEAEPWRSAAGPCSAIRSPSIIRQASFASGSPIALETNGTVREARGLASITYSSPCVRPRTGR